MSDAEDLYEMVHPRPGSLDYLKLVLVTCGMVTVTSLASWAANNAVGVPSLLAPAIPTATFVALIDRANLPTIQEGGHSRTFLAGVGGMLYAAGALSAGA